jgi:hypothetical protein
MPPGGHNTALALEDAALLSRLLAQHLGPTASDSAKNGAPASAIAAALESLVSIRTPRIKAEYEHATQRWEGTKDLTWWQERLRLWGFGVYLRFFAGRVQESELYDVMQIPLPKN